MEKAIEKRGPALDRVDVTVLIPTYNRKDILHKVLSGLFKQETECQFEIVIVDDGSTDGTFESLKELDPPVEVVFISVKHQGPSGARNSGLRISRGDLIIFMDSDIYPSPEFVEAHYRSHTKDNLIGHGPVIHTNDLENPTEAEKKVTDIARAFFATGNASIYRKHLFDAGLFDEDFREYGWEDLEFGLRLRKKGLQKIEVPNAKGYHYKPKLVVTDLHKWKRRERERGHTAVLYYQKHPIRKVKIQTMISPFWFGLDRLLSLGGWTEKPSTEKYLRKIEQKGRKLWLRFVVRLITSHSYFEGIREALREGKN
ncbi:MAG: glycosyltransferase family A protein [Firmicutes bacterium]|nr:glycosyltransferase family A protein [Bacillota bacterium]